MKLPWLLLKMRGMYEPLRIGLLLHRFICRFGGCSIGGDMKEHKHAAALRAIADGVPMSEFEVSHRDDPQYWISAEKYSDWVLRKSEEWEVRRKQQFITVNGFKVPKPVDTKASPNALGTVFWPYITYESLWNSAPPGNQDAQLAVKRGCGHTTKKAAIAHAKAMLGIDPESNHE